MQHQTVVHSLECPASGQPELVELRLSSLRFLQLNSPRVVSCGQREEASECGRCLRPDLD